jgi:hypothetical protein
MPALLRHKAGAARDAEERTLAKVKEREQKQKLRDQQDQQRRIERQRRDEAAIKDRLRQKAIAEARRAQDAENYRLVEQQKLARQTERERKQLLRDQQRRLDRQARDTACMQALLRHEAAAKAKKAQETEERETAKRREKERIIEERKVARFQEKERVAQERGLARLRENEQQQASRIERDEQLRKEGPGQDELFSNPVSPAMLGRPRLTRADIDERRVTRSIQDEQRCENKKRSDEAGIQAIQRHKTAIQAQKAQQILPSFLEEEYQYMKQASADFPETITPSIHMRCIKAYQSAISDASRRLPCALCGGLFQEDEMISIDLQDDDLQHFFRRTNTAPDCCAIKDNMVNLCTTCNSAIAKRAIPLLSAGNFVNCLFCQDYPEVLKSLNAVEEAFIARAHVVGIFLKLTSGAKKGISYRGSRGHSVAVRQDPSQLLKILPTRRLQDHTTINVSWNRGSPPSEENLARFCSVDKAKVLNALLWLCVNNPVYKSVIIDYLSGARIT